MGNDKRWSKAVTVGAAILGVLAVCGLAYASGGGEAAHGGGHETGISPEKWKDLLWRTLNFAALMVILIKFLRKPIANGLSGRRAAIKAQFEDLESRKAQAETTYRQYEQKLSAIEQEVKSILAAAVEQGEVEKNRIIEEAERAAGDIKRQAEMAVQQELAAARSRLREEVADQAAQMAEELIRKNLKEADQVKLIESYLDKVASEDYQQKVVRVQ